MKKIIGIALLMVIALISSCTKDGVEQPDFDVQTSAATYKVEQKITFNFSGKPQLLTFWSGEKGKAYANRQRFLEKGVSQMLQFTSLVTGSDPVAAKNQINNLKLMVSTDFKGVYDAAGIAAATWKDITNRATLSTGKSIASGLINLSDFSTDGSDKPIYTAFYYNSPKNTLKPQQWNISDLTIANTLADGTISTVLPSPISNAGFKFIDLQNPTKSWVISAGKTIVMAAGPIGEPVNEDWAISGAINLNKVMVSDTGLPLQGTSDGLLSEYTYSYTTPGTYKITFVAANSNLKETKNIVKELTLKIDP